MQLVQEFIAANRLRIVQHQRAAVATRRVYPSAATLPHHHALLNTAIGESAYVRVCVRAIVQWLGRLALVGSTAYPLLHCTCVCWWTASEAFEPPDLRLNATRQTLVGTPSEHATILKRAVVLPRVPPTPNSTMWTALSKNYDVEDQPQLKFLPYFGDDDDDDVVSEFYQIKYEGHEWLL